MTSRFTGQPIMALSLHDAYIMLQLDPDNTRQMASFEALSWKYILKYSSVNWQQNTKAGATQLTWNADVSTGGSANEYFEFHDETLNWITYHFVRAQALRLWPTFDNLRSHLLASERGRVIIGDRVIYLGAQHSLMASRNNMKVRPLGKGFCSAFMAGGSLPRRLRWNHWSATECKAI